MPEGQVDTGRITHLPQMHRQFQWKNPVRVATTANGTWATAFDAGSTIDGVVLAEGDRILIKNQTAGEDNGIHVVQAAGAPFRTYDMDDVDEISGAAIYVLQGTANAGKVFVCTTLEPIVLNTDTLTFVDLVAAYLAGLSSVYQPLDADLTAIAGLTRTRGDLIRGGAANWEDFALGADGRLLASDGTDAVWEAQFASIVAVIDGGGATITTGIKGDTRVPFGCVIERASLLADQSGSIVVDIWVDTYANYPPTVADTITASAKPTLASAIKASDITLTGWSTTLAEGSTIRYNVDSVATVQRVMVELKVRKT